jgi:hypothetical protein
MFKTTMTTAAAGLGAVLGGPVGAFAAGAAVNYFLPDKEAVTEGVNNLYENLANRTTFDERAKEKFEDIMNKTTIDETVGEAFENIMNGIWPWTRT